MVGIDILGRQLRHLYTIILLNEALIQRLLLQIEKEFLNSIQNNI